VARGWRVLDAISLEGVVGGTRGRITLSPVNEPVTAVPAEEIALLMIGNQTSIDASAMHYLAKHDIALLATDWRGVPIVGLYPWGDHGRVAARHIAQAELSRPRRKNAWMQLVKAKIVGQAATLDAVDPIGADRLRQLAANVRSGDPANSEGIAARIYWPRLFGTYGTFLRDQDGGDEVNALLNYGYMVLRGYGIRAALSAGLSPPLGLFHHGRANYFNLVDDLIEPFRPAIDAEVLRLGPSASLERAEVKHLMVAAASQPFSSDGYRIPAVLDDLAQRLGRYVEGELDRLAVEAWGGTAGRMEPSFEKTTPPGGLGDLGDMPW